MTTAQYREARAPLSSAWAIEHLRSLASVPFEQVPGSMRRDVYHVPYVELDDVMGGRLWVTQHGWRHLEHLDPARWYSGQQYSRRGQRLSEGTGAVYTVSSRNTENRSINLVVKFSRMAQEVFLHVSSSFPDDVPASVVERAAFNDPFQEFGILEDLRTSRWGSDTPRILTKRPLAIYSPAKTFEPWQLGRTEDRFC